MPGSILLERRLPLSWSLPPQQAVAVDSAHNHLVFTLLDNLEEPALHKPEGEAGAEWMRVDAKLNVIMQLLGQLLQATQPLPPFVDIRFTSDTLAWQVQQSPPPGSLIEVAIYPEAFLPLAVNFVARVQANAEHWMEVDMHGLSEEQLAIWSRWIFRQHRRQIAQNRSHSPSASHRGTSD